MVLAIIALLLALTIASLRNARTRSRDATREEDVKTLQNALALYATNHHVYPATDQAGVYLTGTDPVSTALIQAEALSAVPLDPVNSGANRYHYSSDGQTYTIAYYLETDSIPGKAAGENHASP